MGIRHPESADRVTLEIEFDQHDWFLAHNPTVMPRIDRHDLGSLVFHDTAVGVFDVDFAARQKADVGVHAQGSPDDRFHVDRPPESGRVHHALDAGPSGLPHFKPDAADFPALGASHRGDERIRCFRSAPNGLACFRRGGLSDVLPRSLLFRHVPSPWLVEPLMPARH